MHMKKRPGWVPANSAASNVTSKPNSSTSTSYAASWICTVVRPCALGTSTSVGKQASFLVYHRISIFKN
jgi:hypothetical protein